MEIGDLKRSGRGIAHSRLKTLVLGLFLASTAWSAQAVAQGLPSADSLDEMAPVDEQIEAPEEAAPEPQAPANEGEVASDEADEFVSDTLGEDADDDAADPALSDAPADDGDEDERIGLGVNLEGALGFHHIASAIPGKANTYHIALLGTFSKGSDVIRHGDENEFLGARLLLQATLLEQLSLNLGVGATNNVNTYGRPQSMLAQGDLHLGLRGHFDPAPGVWVAADVTGFLPTGFASSGFDAGAMSVRPRLLVSADFGEILPPTEGGNRIGLKAHFNFGYIFDNSGKLMPEGFRPTRVERFAHQISGYDYLQFGIGLEYALPYVAPFIAWNLDVPVNPDDGVCGPSAPLGCVSEEGFSAFPDTLSVGLRAEPVENLGLTAGVDIGLTGEDAAGVPVTLPWQLVLGASWRIDPEPRVEYVETVVEQEKIVSAEPENAFILGTVTDQQTGQPISGAIITYRRPAEKTAQATNARGTFISYGFAPGKEIVMEVSHPDYAPADARQMIDGPGEIELEVQLKSVAKKGTVGGTVIDQDGQPISGATVKLDGPDHVQVTTGPTGKFSKEIGVGSYTVAASAEGFLTGGRDVQVSADRAVQLEITLKPRPKEDLVEVEADRIRIKQKVFFETGKAKILEKSYDVLNQVASVMLANPGIQKLQVEGHTDDVGAADTNMQLSKERADSVVAYLIEQGVSPERLEAKGLGQTQPLVPNSSSRTRSLNRRVEFKIVGQGGAPTP